MNSRFGRRALGSLLFIAGCGTYAELTPAGNDVVATVTRPELQCTSLGMVVGKGGGGTGGVYVSNETLISTALNDLRNKAAELGATHVVSTSPSMGTAGDGKGVNVVTSAQVMGEALRCEAGTTSAAVPTAGGAAPSLRPAVTGPDVQAAEAVLREHRDAIRQCIFEAPATAEFHILADGGVARLQVFGDLEDSERACLAGLITKLSFAPGEVRAVSIDVQPALR